MSKVIIAITLVTILTAVTLFPGCSNGGSEGDTVTEKKDFTGFTSVEVEGTFEIEITQSGSFSVTVSADESLFDYITVAKEGETLRIYLNPRHIFSDFAVVAKNLKAEITMPNVSGIYLSGAVKSTISGFRSSQDLQLVVSGASSLAIHNIGAGDIKAEISGASKFSGSINATDAEFEVSGASNVKLEGSANNAVLKASGASKIDLTDLPLNNANVNLSGASEVTIHARGQIDTALSGASILYFLGNPTMGNISISGASTIKHK